MIIYYDQVRFTTRKQSWFNMEKLIIHQIKKIKEKNHILTAIDSEKTLDKIQNPFMTKTLSKLGIEKNFLNLIKGIYEKPTS